MPYPLELRFYTRYHHFTILPAQKISHSTVLPTDNCTGSSGMGSVGIPFFAPQEDHGCLRWCLCAVYLQPQCNHAIIVPMTIDSLSAKTGKIL